MQYRYTLYKGVLKLNYKAIYRNRLLGMTIPTCTDPAQKSKCVTSGQRSIIVLRPLE